MCSVLRAREITIGARLSTQSDQRINSANNLAQQPPAAAGNLFPLSGGGQHTVRQFMQPRVLIIPHPSTLPRKVIVRAMIAICYRHCCVFRNT